MTESSTIHKSAAIKVHAIVPAATHAKELRSLAGRSRVILEVMFKWALIATLFAIAMPVRAQAPRANSAAPATDNARKASMINAGRIVFNQRCEICHYIDSRAQKIGPGLAGLFARAKFASGAKVSETTVANIIDEGGKDMPAYRTVLKPGQLQSLLAYLKSH